MVGALGESARKRLNLAMYEYKAKVLSVYDADTVTVDIDLGCWVSIDKEKCRLFGIDAPEMRGEERPKGIVARDALREMILGEEVTIRTKCDKTGKYGRLLVDIYHDGIHINQWLIDNDYAVVANY